MKNHASLAVSIILLALAISCGSVAMRTTQDETSLIANPAAIYCVDKGGTSIIETQTNGSMVGLCQFADGSECEEWEFFYMKCNMGTCFGWDVDNNACASPK